MKIHFHFFLRLISSLFFLTLLFYSVELSDLIRYFLQVHLVTAVLCFAFIGAGICLSIYKWQGFLQVHGIRSGYWDLARLYLIGSFFNNFIPTPIGGDVVRATLLCKDKAPPSEVVASIFAERFTGLLMVCLYGIGGVLFVSELFIIIRVPLMAIAAITLFFCCILASGYMRLRIGSAIASRFGALLERFISPLLEYLKHYRALIRAAWTSAIFQLLVATTYYIVAMDIDMKISFGIMLVVVSLVTLLTLIPISLNGIGVRECGFVFLLSSFDIDESAAVALSLTVYAVVLSVSLLGLLLFITRVQKN